MYKVGIAGATGYTGLELMRLIQRHPQLDIGWLTSESSAGGSFADVHAVPWQQPLIPLAEATARADEVDVVFLCLPHAASIEPVRAFVEAGVRVIDLSADYRLKDVATYERWYGVPHTAPELLDAFVADRLALAKFFPSATGHPAFHHIFAYPFPKGNVFLNDDVIDAASFR